MYFVITKANCSVVREIYCPPCITYLSSYCTQSRQASIFLFEFFDMQYNQVDQVFIDGVPYSSPLIALVIVHNRCKYIFVIDYYVRFVVLIDSSHVSLPWIWLNQRNCLFLYLLFWGATVEVGILLLKHKKTTQCLLFYQLQYDAYAHLHVQF